MVTGARCAILFVVILSVAACAGQAPATADPVTGGGTPAAGAGATDAPPAGDEQTAAPPAAGLDACGIVTTAEIEQVIGTAVTAESGGEPVDGQSICTFSTADGEGVLYTAYDPDGATGFDVWKTQDDAQPVPGLGDEAIFQPQIGLLVRRGQATYQFFPLGGLSPEEALSMAVELAQAASSRF